MADDKITLRMPDDLIAALDARAEETNLSRSELIRRRIWFAEEAAGDRLAEAADLESQIERTIENNQTLRDVLPSKWRAHVKRLFVDDIRDDASPQDLRVIADGYRRQARQYEQLLETVPNAPDVEPGTHEEIVDEELTHALEACDLSNWYERVENPYEHLAGVEEGRNERELVRDIIRGVLNRRYEIARAFGTDGPHITIDGVDIPSGAVEQLPDRFEPEQIAAAVNELAANGVQPEDVDDVLPLVDPELNADPIDVDSETVDDVDPEDVADMETADAAVVGGTLYPDGLPGDVDDDGQAELPARIPASDGGTSEGSPFADESPDEQPANGSESDDEN